GRPLDARGRDPRERKRAARDLHELSDDGVPARRGPGPRDVQRLPRGPCQAPALRPAPAGGLGRAAARDHGARARRRRARPRRARNAGLEAATGEIVAYLDADAECHPEWPFHLVISLEGDSVAATGGPNPAPPGAPFAERAVAQAPGGPVHVLVADDRAEHVP